MIPHGIPSARVQLFAERAAWLSARANSEDGTAIGASEVAQILGIHPQRGPWDLWTARRRGEVDDDVEDIAPEEGDDDRSAADPADPLERGQIWEPFVRELAGRFLGREVLAPGEPFGDRDAISIIKSAAYPWLQASVDGWVVEPDGSLATLELKTDATRGWKWGASGTVITRYEAEGGEGLVPPHYYTQCAWQRLTTGVTHGYCVVLLGSYRVRWFRIERDEDTERQLVRAVAAWRQRCLLDGEIPDRDDSDACITHYREAHRGRAEGTRRATDEEADWIELLVARKDAEKGAAAGRSGLLASMGDLKGLYLPPGPSGQPRGVSRSKAGALTVYGF